MGHFKPIRRRSAGKYCAEHTYRRKNPVVHVKSYASKAQIMDAYDLMYREMLRHESRGDKDSARQLEMILEDFGRTKKDDDDKCVLVNEVMFDGTMRKRWVHINRIDSVSKARMNTRIRFVDGVTMYVNETVDEVLLSIRRR